jgi:hypothetical protein
VAVVPYLDILKRSKDGAYIWLEAAYDLEEAKKCLLDLSRGNSEEFFVYSQRTQQVVVSLSGKAPIR